MNSSSSQVSLFQRQTPGIIGGLVSGFYIVIFMYSYAAIIYTGSLSEFLPYGAGALLFGTVVISLILGIKSAFPGVITAPNDNPVAISAVLAIAIVSSLPDNTQPQTMLMTVLISIAISTMITGILFILIAHFKLGNMVRYIPYPVIGGFLAGTGLIIFRGAFVASSDTQLSLSTIGALMQPTMIKFWAPALLFGVIMLVVLNRYSHFLIVPGVVITALGLFYIILALSGMSISEAANNGWLLKAASGGGNWRPILPADLLSISWPLILSQLPMILTISAASVIAVLLNTTALESAFGKDADTSKELKYTGIANVIASFGGSAVGYHYVGMSVLMKKMKADTRIVGVIVSLICLLAIFLGPTFTKYVPKFLLGGLAFFIGLAFLYDWVYQSIIKLKKLDLAVILTIMLVVVLWGPIPGVVSGLGITALLFILNYSRIDMVKHSFSGASLHSHIERPTSHRKILHDKGEQIYIIKLHGYIFFGTSNRLLEHVTNRLESTKHSSVKYIIFDFQNVHGLDSSALHSFVKLKQLGQNKDFKLLYAHMPKKVNQFFETEKFIDGDALVSDVYSDLDHALECCENEILHNEEIDISLTHHCVKEFLTKALRNESAAEILLEYAEKIDVDADQLIVKEGTQAEAMYFLEKGRLNVTVNPEKGNTTRLRTINPGSFAGIIGVFSEQGQHSASIVSTIPCILYRFKISELNKLKEEHPSVITALHEYVLHLLADRLMKTTELVEEILEVDE